MVTGSPRRYLAGKIPNLALVVRNMFAVLRKINNVMTVKKTNKKSPKLPEVKSFVIVHKMIPINGFQTPRADRSMRYQIRGRELIAYTEGKT